MKSAFHRFLIGSVMIILTLGVMQGDRSLNAYAQTIEQSEEVQISYWSAIQSQVAEASDKGSEHKTEKKEAFTFKFPNIFDVFRSLF